MRWAITQTTKQYHSWKLEGIGFSAEIKYNKDVHSFRVIADDQRLFFIERTGLLQQKFLLKTEYSVAAGEVHPTRSWQSGVAIFKEKKFHYALKGNLLILASRKQDFSLAIEMDSINPDPFEFCALLFGTLKIVSRIYHAEPVVAM